MLVKCSGGIEDVYRRCSLPSTERLGQVLSRWRKNSLWRLKSFGVPVETGDVVVGVNILKRKARVG